MAITLAEHALLTSPTPSSAGAPRVDEMVWRWVLPDGSRGPWIYAADWKDDDTDGKVVDLARARARRSR